MPGVLGHQHVVLELIVEGRARLLLDLRVQDAVHASIVALLAVEVAVHGFAEERIDHLILLLLGDQDVDVELGPEAGDVLHQLERRHLQHAGAVALRVHGVERVVDHDRLDVAVLLDRVQRLLCGGDAHEDDTERVVQAASGRVEPLDELAQHQALVVDHEDPAERLQHGCG
jgi:hypothetical protein